MDVTSLNGIGGTLPQTGVTNASDKLQAALASIVSNNQSSDNVAAVSIAAQLQSQTSALKTVADNLTQGLSLTQVAEGGIEQIQSIIGQLQSLASQAQSPVLNANNRRQLNQTFQQLSSQLTTIAGTTSFNGQNTLDGSLSGANALSLDSMLGKSSGSDNILSIANQSANSLFGGALDISSAEGASQALAALGNAQNEVTGTQSNIGAFQQTLNYALANVDSAITNQQAAQSSISDTDIASASTQTSLADVQYNAAIAVAAQTNNLNPALLQLVG